MLSAMDRFWHTDWMQPDMQATFASRLVAWQQIHGRHDLPWQVADPYAIWVSEIMLQQTQVETVIPYFQRFLRRFPEVAALAGADVDVIMAQWAGLGYYSRARNLHAAARRIVELHAGVFPSDIEAILALPGIGRSTAAAIAVFAFDQRQAILDGNVKRVLCRVFGVEGWPGSAAVEQRLWALARALLPADDIQAYTQGLMDLGATLCMRTRPQCGRCPFADDCLAHRHGRQAELPAPRGRKQLPEKSTVMLVFVHAGEVMLEKRPPSGIWGGLWSLPQCDGPEDVSAACRRLGLRVTSSRSLAAFTHSFSHFRLSIQPMLLQVEQMPKVAEASQLWLDPRDLADAAVPTPVRRIIASLVSAEQPVEEP
jgi:A/G-specific adenine glycosylase